MASNNDGLGFFSHCLLMEMLPSERSLIFSNREDLEDKQDDQSLFDPRILGPSHTASGEVSNGMNHTQKTSPNPKRFTRKLSSDDEEDLPPSKRQAYDVEASQQSLFSVAAFSLYPAEIDREARVPQLKNVSQLNEDVKTQMSRASPNGYESDFYNASPDENSALFMDPRQMHNPNRPDLIEVQSPPMFSQAPDFSIGGRSVSVGLNDDNEEKITEPLNMFSRPPSPGTAENPIETDEDSLSMTHSFVFHRQEEMSNNLSDTDSDTLTDEATLPSIEISSDDDSNSSNDLEVNLSDHSDRNVNEPWSIEDRFVEVHELVTDTQHATRKNHKIIKSLQVQNSDQIQKIASVRGAVESLRDRVRNQAEEASRLRGEITELKDENARLNTRLGASVVELMEQVRNHNEQLTELRKGRVSELRQGTSVDKNEVTGLQDEIARLNNKVLKLEREALEKEIEKLRMRKLMLEL